MCAVCVCVSVCVCSPCSGPALNECQLALVQAWAPMWPIDTSLGRDCLVSMQPWSCSLITPALRPWTSLQTTLHWGWSDPTKQWHPTTTSPKTLQLPPDITPHHHDTMLHQMQKCSHMHIHRRIYKHASTQMYRCSFILAFDGGVMSGGSWRWSEGNEEYTETKQWQKQMQNNCMFSW